MISTQHLNNTAITFKDSKVTYTELLQNINNYAGLLEGKKLTKIAIFAENQSDWIYAFYAAWQHDVTVVPVDFMAAPDDVAYILNDCKPEFIFYSKNTADILDKALLQTEHSIEKFRLADPVDTKVPKDQITPPDMDKTAVIIYTSGTTGSPKGVMLSYTNLMTNVQAVSKDVPIYNSDTRTLLILPLQHIFPLIGAMMVPLITGGTIVIASSLQGADILETLNKHKVTLIIGVPRLFEMIYKGVYNKINASPIGRLLYKLVISSNSPKFGKKVFKKVHETFGGHLTTLVAGGAALPMDVGQFYYGLGFDILEGYGMTEASPMIAFTHPGDVIVGCCGKTMSCLDVEVREGEIVARGKSIMKGYYNRPEETAEVIKDGWLHTGDIGYIKDDRVYITGRKKEIIVLSNGKNINPVEIEEGFMKKSEDLFSEVGVVMHEEVLHAIILPNFSAFAKKEITDVKGYINNFLTTEYNPNVTPYKQISKFTLVKESLPRTRLSKLQRFKLSEIAAAGEIKTERKPEPDSKEYLNIKKFLQELLSKDVYADSHLVFDLALDSLAKLELIDYISRTFGIEIKEEDLLNYTSVGEMVQFITSHKQHFTEEEFDWHEIMTQPIELNLSKPSWTLSFGNQVIKTFLNAFFNIKSTGNIELPEGAAIIAPNHGSYLDGFLVTSLMKKKDINQTYFYAKKEHVNTPWRRFLAKRNNVIVMDIEKDLNKSIQQLAQLLRDGKRLVIFPEGTRSRTGDLGDFKKTFAILSQEIKVPVYPVAIKGAFEAFPRHRKMPIMGAKIEINYLDVVNPREMDAKLIAQTVKDNIQKAL